MEQQYILEQAQQWLFVEPRARTDAEFRQELFHFYTTWRELNLKKEGTGPAFWSEKWKKKHKLGKILYERYRRYRTDIRQREVDDSRGLTSSVTSTTAATLRTEISTNSGAQTTVVTTTTTEQTISSTTGDPTNTSEAMDTSATSRSGPAALPVISDEDVDMILGDAETMEQAAASAEADFHSGKHDHLLDEDKPDEANPTSPPPQPTDLVGTEGATGAVATDLVASAVGNTGEAAGTSAVQQTTVPTSSQPATLANAGIRLPDQQFMPPPPGRLSPGIQRHRNRCAKDDRALIPVIDPSVFKDFTALLNDPNITFTPWLGDFLNTQNEFHGYINAYQAPWIYLGLGQYANLPDWKAAHHLANVTMDSVMAENLRLLHQYVLGNTFGIEPWLWPMVTDETCLALTRIAKHKYWKVKPGHPLRVSGLGPTGFDLSNCNDYEETFVGQRRALLRHVYAADATEKCLRITISKDKGAFHIDAHEEARKALREQAKFVSSHPIHLQGFTGIYEDLCGWLEQFPNTVIAFDYLLLDNFVEIEDALKDNPTDRHYAPVIGLLEFCKWEPLKNFAIQSAPYSLNGKRLERKPGHLLAAAALLQRVTGTPAEVYPGAHGPQHGAHLPAQRGAP